MLKVGWAGVHQVKLLVATKLVCSNSWANGAANQNRRQAGSRQGRGCRGCGFQKKTGGPSQSNGNGTQDDVGELGWGGDETPPLSEKVVYLAP